MNDHLLIGVLVLALGACAQQSVTLHQQGAGSARLVFDEEAPLTLAQHCPQGAQQIQLTRRESPVDGLLTLASLGSYRPEVEVRCE